MRHGSLFSGIGGFDLAAEWMGWENVFHCEWMEFPRKVLDYYFPNADSHIDICKTDFKKYANTIDILTGGFPCQPFSTAGKRKGTDDERYLWGEMLRAIQEIKPKYVIAENVFGITNIDGGLVFEQVCLDLEAEGYEVQPFIICAAAKNAPHRRDRCWFIAQNTMFSRCVHGESEQERAEVWKQRNTCSGSSERIHLSEGNATDNMSRDTRKGWDSSQGCSECSIVRRKAKSSRIVSGQSFCNGTKETRCESCGNIQKFSNSENATNSDSNGFNERNGNDEINTSKGGKYAQRNIGKSNDNGDVTDTTSTGGGQDNRKGKSRLYDKKSSTNNWSNFPTEPPICGGDDGIPSQLDGITFSKWRAESIKGYGNAIVPQVAYEIFKQL
jgi:DNA (cytosine-5)-methyltransferase 1